MKAFRKAIALVTMISVLISTLVLPNIVLAQENNSVFLSKDAQWKYLDNGVDLGTSWITDTFDDSTWKTGKAPFGFGDDFSETDPTLPLATTVEFGDPVNKYMTTYFRKTIDVANLSDYAALQVYIHVDDGAVVYINGKEAFRRGIADDVTVDYNTTAKFKPKEETFQIPVSMLKEGKNIIAAEVHQDGGDSSDLWFEMSITGLTDGAFLAKDAVWNYMDDGKDLGTSFTTDSFDDSAWKSGKAPLGFGDDFSETDPTLPLATTVEYGDPANKYMTTYFRKTIDVANLSAYAALEVYIHVDDGAVVYINGKEAFRRGIADDVAVDYNTTAKFKPKEETFQVPTSILKEGKNIIAVEVHQDGGDSSDLWFEMSIKGLTNSALEATGEPVAQVDTTAPVGKVSKVTVTVYDDTTSTRGFTWYTTAASGNSDLQVVENEGKAADFSKALSFTGTFAASTNSKDEFYHKAEATGLKAGTSYYYRVGDAKLGIWSEVGTFKTAKATGAFTFIDLADSQAKTEDEAILSSETFAKAIETVNNAEFFMINGDIVDTGLNEQQWDWLLGHSKDSFMNMTLVPAAGNHEEQKNSFIEHFDVKPADKSDTSTGAYYSFDYSNAHFIVLNNNEESKSYDDFSPAQIGWLYSDVKAAKAKGAQWIIVTMHKGPYSTSNHATDSDQMGPNGNRTLVAPLMAELGIDFVLQGHDHIYARTKPIKDGEATQTTKITETLNGKSIEYTVDPDGTIYLIPGTAGPKVYYKNKDIDPSYYDLFEVADENHASVYGPDPEDPGRPVRSQIQNFIGITIDGNKLTAVSYEIDQSKNNAEPYIVDQFGIVKNETAAVKSSSSTTYIVQAGDLLWQIAQTYGLTWKQLSDYNNLKDANVIFPGQKLLIP